MSSPVWPRCLEAAAAALSDREESTSDNPYLARTPRVFGPKPGQYGLSMGAHIEDYSEDARAAAGEAWITASSHAIDAQGDISEARVALEERLRGADSFVHLQDLPETDVLIASDYAAHEAGFAAAMSRIGAAAPALYHLDATRPDRPQARSLGEEIARVTRARASNPDWATSMMQHGFRGGAEIAATLDHMAAFAHLAQVVPAHLFDLYFEATLGREDLVAFMEVENPAALQAMRDRFRALAEAGLWATRRNSIIAMLDLEGAA